MAPSAPQTFANHARYVPLYHFVLLAVLLLNLGWSIWQLWRGFGAASAIGLLLALALFGIYFYTRQFALTVQNRVIRLEERLRLERLLPPDLVPRIDELRLRQLIALRFAGDDEVAALFREIVEGRLTDPIAIKRAVRNWRADYLRA